MRDSTIRKAVSLVEAAHDQNRLLVARPDQRRRLKRALGSGAIVSPYPQVYALKEFWNGLSCEQRTRCASHALAELHPEWVFAGPTAGLFHGLWVGWPYLNEVCVAQRRGTNAHGREGVKRITVSGDRPCERDGLQVTSYLRTVYDCMRMMSFPDALAIADSALRAKGITRQRLEENVDMLYRRMPGMRRVREIIALADGRAEDGGESFARAQMIRLGFVIPDLQRELTDPLHPGKRYRVDFAWDLPDGSLVIGELDGREKYVNPEMTGGKSTDEVMFDERRRESHVTLLDRPVRVMRFTLAETKDLVGFERLLTMYGIQRVVATPEVARMK